MLNVHAHTWVWTNFTDIPNTLVKKNQFYRLKDFLLEKKKPAIIFTGTGTDLIYNKDNTLEDNVFSKLTEKQLEKIKDIDVYLYEPVTFKFVEELQKTKMPSGSNHVCRYGFYEEFDKDSKFSDMTIIEFDHLQNIATKYNVNFKIYSCDYNISTTIKNNYNHLYPNINSVCYDIFIRDTAQCPDGINHSYPVRSYSEETSTIIYERGYEPKLTNKICSLNLRYATHRHLVAAHLSNKDSILTWNYKINRKLSTHNFKWLDGDIIDCDLYDYLSHQHLEEKLNLLTNRKRNDRPVEISDHYHSKSINQNYIGYNNNHLIKKVHHCFLYVVTESRFCQPLSNISEKVLRSYAAKRPFVIVAPPYSLEYLSKLGYKSFDKWWDESYDTEENHTKRLKKIFDIIDYIDSLSYDDLYSLLTEMKSVIDYNFNHVKLLRKDKIILQ